MKWTQAQQKTIETRGRNILVSAAAGSGKTTVMIERVKQLVLRDHIDIDRFLITTFTRAAASEMKEKMENAIRGELAEVREGGSSPGERREAEAFLQRQLALLPRSNISTFHTFAIGILKEFFYLTDLDPGIEVGDEVRVSILQKDTVDEIFEERFETGGERFRAFLKKYSGDRSDEKLKQNILEMYNQLRSLPGYLKHAREAAERLRAEEPLQETGIAMFLLEESVRSISEAAAWFDRAAEVLSDSGADSYYEKALSDVEQAASLYRKAGEEAEKAARGGSAVSSLAAVREMVLSFTPARMGGTKAEKEYWEAVKEQVGDLRGKGKKALEQVGKKYLGQDLDAASAVLNRSYDDTVYYIGILEELETRFREKKKDLNIIDFDDVMHEALRILEHEEAASEYRSRFSYIFIDEYQDSNLLQEEIVERIAREDNLFMVGDIKQSIYRFRLAEPEIFRQRYISYRDGGGKSVKIDLNSNFRSRKTVRDAVNRVFDSIMEEYDEDARLNGIDDPENPGAPVGLHIIDRKEAEEDDPADEITEAELTAAVIRDCVGRTFTDKSGSVRTIGYGDIAVLSRGGSSIPGIERYLNNEGIPAFGDTAGGYYETVEIQVFLNLLRLISNFRQDIPLISAMSSSIFDFRPSELAAVRVFTRSGSYTAAVERYAKEGPDEGLALKIREMKEQIGLWKEIARTVPLDELMRILLYETGYYDYCAGLPVGKQRISNLRLLMEKAAAFEKTSHSGLYGFLRYVEAMKKSDQKVGEAQSGGESGDVVRVMTVHKSKGLEFPVVILTGAGKKITSGRSEKPAVMHRAFGIGLPEVNRELHWERKTLLQRAIAERKKRENLEEEIRILYVAMTRAMERLEIIGSVRDAEKLPEIPGTGSYIEMIWPSFRDMAEESGDAAYVKIYRGADEEGEAEGEGSDKEHEEHENGREISAEEEKLRGGIDERLREEIERRLSFVYPYEAPRIQKQKYSVTELTRKEAAGGGEPQVRLPELRSFGAEDEREREKTALTAAETGTVMHAVMERADFSRAVSEGEPYLKELVRQLKEKGIFSEEEADAADIGSLTRFFSGDLARRASEAPALMREKEFIMSRDVDGAPAIVQGVIDCFFEEEDGIVLIDYKNSRAETDGEKQVMLQRYAPQIRLYREALRHATGKKVKESWLYLFRSGTLLAVE